MAKTKEVLMRTFKINSKKMSTENNLCADLDARVMNTKASERTMRLSQKDNDLEQDSLTIYDKIMDDCFYGIVMRIDPQKKNATVSDELLNQNAFHPDDVKTEAINDNIYKSHFYFCTKGDLLVTAGLPINTNITRLQVFINWLLKDQGFIYELNPLIKPAPEVTLSSVSSVEFSDPISSQEPVNIATNTSKYQTITKNFFDKIGFLKKILSDTNQLDSEELSQIVDAKVLLKIKKPTSMTDEDFQSKYGALLKPLNDLENMRFKTKDGRTIASTDIMAHHRFHVELTSQGNYNDEELKQKMISYLDECNVKK